MRIKVIIKMACDFCGKSQDDVALLIAGPRDIAICNECVDLCVGVIAKEKPETAEPARLGSTEVMSDQSDVLAELRKQTPLLEVLAKQGDWAAKHERYGPPYTGTGSSSVSGSSCLASASPPPS